MIEQVIEKWHRFMRGDLPGGLDELLADDVVFHSPVVYTPQEGKAITTLYLQAAAQALPGDGSADAGGATSGGGRFRYTKEVVAGDTAVLTLGHVPVARPCRSSSMARARVTRGTQPHPRARSVSSCPVQTGSSVHSGSTPSASVTVPR